MMAVLLWLCKAVLILAMAIVAIILLVIIVGLIFAIGYGIYEGWKDGDG